LTTEGIAALARPRDARVMAARPILLSAYSSASGQGKSWKPN
jgi:hypothetical protein